MGIFLIKVIQLVSSISILVLIHELGHVFFSRLLGVKVEKFYLFFNPWFSLFKYKSKISGTEYGLGWLPFGGYAKISGMIDESLNNSFLNQEPKSWEYRSKSVWQRFLISIGGVLMNFILAFFIYSVIVFKWGDHFIPINKTPLFFGELAHQIGFKDHDILIEADGKLLTRYDDLDLFRVIDAHQVTILRKGKKKRIIFPSYFRSQLLDSKSLFSDYRLALIDGLLPGGNAEKVGLKKGDKIISVENKTTSLFGEVCTLISKNKNKKILLGIDRMGENITFKVQVDPKGKIGFFSFRRAPLYNNVRYRFMGSFSAGLTFGFRELSFYVCQLKLFFTKAGIKNIGGFVAIEKLFPPVWDLFTFLNMTAFLSIMLGVMNSLPIPALDGGHVLFLLYEAIFRKKISTKILEYAQLIGMIFLITLLVYANGMDLIRFFLKK